jgi:hypothetical protein
MHCSDVAIEMLGSDKYQIFGHMDIFVDILSPTFSACLQWQFSA